MVADRIARPPSPSLDSTPPCTPHRQRLKSPLLPDRTQRTTPVHAAWETTVNTAPQAANNCLHKYIIRSASSIHCVFILMHTTLPNGLPKPINEFQPTSIRSGSPLAANISSHYSTSWPHVTEVGARPQDLNQPTSEHVDCTLSSAVPGARAHSAVPGACNKLCSQHNAMQNPWTHGEQKALASPVCTTSGSRVMSGMWQHSSRAEHTAAKVQKQWSAPSCWYADMAGVRESRACRAGRKITFVPLTSILQGTVKFQLRSTVTCWLE